MAAINSIVVREEVMNLMKRKSWPAKNAGVMVVFCIVGVVGIALVALWISKFISRRKEKKERAAAKAVA